MASASAARIEQMVNQWRPSEQQLEAMTVEELQTLLKQWKVSTKFTTKDALLAKVRKAMAD